MRWLIWLMFLGGFAQTHAEVSLGDFLFEHVSNSLHLGIFHFIHLNLEPFIFMIGKNNFGASAHTVMIVLGFILALIFLPWASKRKNGLPVSRWGYSIEGVVLFIRDQISIPNLGEKDGKKWLPFLCTLFFFLLFLNLLGLIFTSVTANINFTATLALIVFFTFNIAGILKNGLFHYGKGLVPTGVPVLVNLILFPIELIGLFTKACALAIRLFATMTSGHLIIYSLLGIISQFHESIRMASISFGLVVPGMVLFTLFMSILELLVAFMQAYIFTMLTSIFLGSALNQNH
jgi:F-type H+-transporting ATPase subunit a